MTLAYSMKINPKKMKKLEKEYTVIKTKEQEEMVELRVSCGVATFRKLKINYLGNIFV